MCLTSIRNTAHKFSLLACLTTVSSFANAKNNERIGIKNFEVGTIFQIFFLIFVAELMRQISNRELFSDI